ncbi:fimbrial protein [Budvicia diplopodorum]|uniref:fimbrial protein n=1 Tax=Budvicia diplopodorum TaxID=1119056 RepID=UPI00135CC314|nr:fimbrial protein [Budvicia diplopodorum]
MRKINRNRLYAVAAGLALGLCSVNAFAGNYCVNLDGKDYRVPMSSLPIDPEAPDGAIIFTRFVDDIAGPKYTCASGRADYASRMSSAFSTIVGNNSRGNIYASGIPGIGLQVSDLEIPSRVIPQRDGLSPNELIPFWGPDNRIRIDFIKTGPISSGKLTSGKVAIYEVDDTPVATISLLSNISWVTKSCTIDGADRNKVVPLGTHRVSQFNGIGSVSTDSPFSLTLNCQKDSAPVYVSFEPTTGSTGDGLLNIDSSVTGAATGVAVEVVNQSDRSRLKFRNEVKYHMAAESTVILPFIARYRQTGSTIKPGKANAAMTFTINQN